MPPQRSNGTCRDSMIVQMRFRFNPRAGNTDFPDLRRLAGKNDPFTFEGAKSRKWLRIAINLPVHYSPQSIA